MIEAVVLGMEDAGLSYDVPPIPTGWRGAGNSCSVKFEFDGNEYVYEYQCNGLTPEILSKKVTPIGE